MNKSFLYNNCCNNTLRINAAGIDLLLTSLIKPKPGV
jgi:hypothetical protein